MDNVIDLKRGKTTKHSTREKLDNPQKFTSGLEGLLPLWSRNGEAWHESLILVAPVYWFLHSWVWHHSEIEAHPVACCEVTDFMLWKLEDRTVHRKDVKRLLKSEYGSTADPFEDRNMDQTELYPSACIEWGRWAYERVQRKPLTVRAACRELVKHTDLIAQGYLTYDHRRLKGTHKLRDELGLKIEYLK